jgi:hypothetical protein
MEDQRRGHIAAGPVSQQGTLLQPLMMPRVWSSSNWADYSHEPTQQASFFL